jgi:hypothetical protein
LIDAQANFLVWGVGNNGHYWHGHVRSSMAPMLLIANASYSFQVYVLQTFFTRTGRRYKV